jgi:hypothetical protein
MFMRGFLVFSASLAFATSACARADAEPKSSPAKGTKECLIGQPRSEFVAERHAEVVRKMGVKFYEPMTSRLKFRVLKSGSVTVSITDDVFPGTKVYFMVGGKRYAGGARQQLRLDGHALTALKQDQPIDFTYTIWPYRNEVNRKDAFSGFAAAYDECRRYLN